MLQRVLKCGSNIASYGRQKSKLWIPRVMPFLILLGYLEEALLVALHLHVPASLRSFNVIGSICQLADIGIILAGIGLTLIGWHAESGVCLLLLHRSVQRFYDSGMWITDLLEHFVDAGCLLLLLALRLSQRQMLDSNNNIKSSSSSRGIEQAQLQRWLQLGRIGMSCEFLVWFFENQRQVRSNCAALHSLKCNFDATPPSSAGNQLSILLTGLLHINAAWHTLHVDVLPGGTVPVVARLLADEQRALFRLERSDN